LILHKKENPKDDVIPLGVAFWHKEKIVELIEGDVGSPNSILSCIWVFLQGAFHVTIKLSNHHQTLSPKYDVRPYKRDVFTFKGQTLGKGGLGIIIQDVFSCLHRKFSPSICYQGVGHGIHYVGFMPQ
jgi:hypothetical protein